MMDAKSKGYMKANSALGLSIALLFASRVFASGSVPALLPFDGRLMDSAGAVITAPTVVSFRIYPPTGTCYLYEDTQTVVPSSLGLFSTSLGDPANISGPANSFITVFSNDSVLTLNTSCSGTLYTPASNDWRRLEIVVAGTPLAGMQTIGSAAFAINASLFDGKTAASFLAATSTVTQANLTTLTGAGDAGALHHHDTRYDARYVKSDGSTPMTGSLTTATNIIASQATSKIGIGTASPTADFQIAKSSPSMLMQSTSGSNGQMSVAFNSGATQRGLIKVSESANGIQFYSGSSQAMAIDSSGNLNLNGALSVTGTTGLGRFTDAQETTMAATLTVLNTGALWVNTTVGAVKFWDGTTVRILSVGSPLTSVTSGLGLSNSGTGAAPVLDVIYGTSANSAIEGNQVFAGDISGTVAALSVDKLKGTALDFTVAPTTGQVLTYGAGGKWIPASPSSSGITSLNSLTGATQTLAVGTTGTAPLFSSASSTHTLNIPMASAASVTAGLLSNTDYTSFSGKVAKAGDTMTGSLVLNADPSAALGAVTKQYVDTAVASVGGGIQANGSVAFTANQPFGGFKATGLADPTLAQDAATKAYVDTGLATKFTKGGDSFGSAASIGTNDGYAFSIKTNNATAVTVDTSGNVGVAQATPTAKLDVNGHIANSATGVPVVSSCGTTTNGTIVGNDTRGTVTFGTATPASCTINFATAYGTAPICVVSGASNTSNRYYITAVSTTAITVTQSTATSSTKFNYICMQ